jgi:beta-mannosidase
MVGGVCGDLYLGATTSGRIEHVYTSQKHGSDRCELEVTCEVASPTGGSTALEVACGTAAASRPVELQPGLNTLTTTVSIENPRLWWPAGYGEPHLYDLTVRVAGDELRKRVGLRTLKLVNEEDETGLSMYFNVNGIKVFCKGADWIPCDALPARQTRARYDDLLSSAVAANMNMLRVWGGGQYERDDFYDLCDEKGILIWQDFMFSCALYPATPEFLESVRQEAEYQVKRLRDHASLALWCGNNEDVGALNWFKESRANRDRYLIDYDRLNEGVLGAAVDRFDPTRVFWPSSPCGGRGDYSDCWHKDNRGDMHYWKVWHEGAHFEAYYDVVPRFCSEFGYQSFPSLDTVRSYAPPEQFNVTAPIMEHHQRNRAGNSKIIEMFSRYFRMPEGFENFLYLSQVQQGVAIKMAVEFWRHLQPTCMGALYWQLNDNWPVCSWSSLEYSGKWKLLHYMAKRFFAPQLLAAFQSRDGKLQLWLVNDEPRQSPCRVTWRVLEYGGRELRRASVKVVAPATGARCVLETTVDKIIADRAAGFMELETDRTTTFNTHFFHPWKQCELPAPNLRTAQRRQGTGFAVTLTTDKPAFFVSLNAAGVRGEFDDNAFTLLPREPRTVVFTPRQPLSAKQFAAALTVRHLRDTYR